MSMAAYKWAKTWELSSPQKFVLLMIADHYNEKDKRAWPSIETLASETGLDPRTVSRALRELETQGLIQTESWFRTGSNKRMSNRYCLPFHDSSKPCLGTVKREPSPVLKPVDNFRRFDLQDA